jgi:hypothetical protein
MKTRNQKGGRKNGEGIYEESRESGLMMKGGVAKLSLRGKTMSKKENRKGSHSMKTEGKGENYYMKTTGVDSGSG